MMPTGKRNLRVSNSEVMLRHSGDTKTPTLSLTVPYSASTTQQMIGNGSPKKSQSGQSVGTMMLLTVLLLHVTIKISFQQSGSCSQVSMVTTTGLNGFLQTI